MKGASVNVKADKANNSMIGGVGVSRPTRPERIFYSTAGRYTGMQSLVPEKVSSLGDPL